MLTLLKGVPSSSLLQTPLFSGLPANILPDCLNPKVVSDTPKADANNTLSVNSDGYAQEVEVKIPQGEPTVNKVGGQRRMLASKKSTVKWY